MPSNDDIKHKSDEAVKGRASGAMHIASVLPDDNAHSWR